MSKLVTLNKSWINKNKKNKSILNVSQHMFDSFNVNILVFSKNAKIHFPHDLVQ